MTRGATTGSQPLGGGGARPAAAAAAAAGTGLARAGRGAAPPPAAAASDKPEADEDGSGGDDGDDLDAAAAASVQRRLFQLRGALAGRAAADAARERRPYSTEPPEAVEGASESAQLAWFEAFQANFKTPDASAADPVVAGLVAKASKRRRRTASEPNTQGAAGLKESAEAVVSSSVYAQVRTHFFLPDDHGLALVTAGLKESGFVFTEDELTAWWEEKGHRQALAKAKSARHLSVEGVKLALWLAHGALVSASASRYAMFLTRRATHSGHERPPHAPGAGRQRGDGAARLRHDAARGRASSVDARVVEECYQRGRVCPMAPNRGRQRQRVRQAQVAGSSEDGLQDDGGAGQAQAVAAGFG